MDKSYASLKDPIVQAMVHGYYRFANEAQAAAQLDIIKAKFFISRQHGHTETPTSCIMWIKGLEVTEAEKAQGGMGNFAQITCTPHEGGQLTLRVEKLPMEPKLHPQKHRLEQRNPNWGHFILRHIEKHRPYAKLEEAQNALISLQQEYPHAAIPGNNSLSLMVYERTPQDIGKNHVKRYALTIKALPEGGYVIDYALIKKPTKAKKSPPPQPKGEPVGFFSAKVRLKQKKK